MIRSDHEAHYSRRAEMSNPIGRRLFALLLAIVAISTCLNLFFLELGPVQRWSLEAVQLIALSVGIKFVLKKK